MSEKHLIRLTERAEKVSSTPLIESMNLDEKIKEHFKDVTLLSYEIEAMDQSSVFVADGRVIISTSLIVNIVIDEPADYSAL